MTLSAGSRITSSSNSFQPSTDSSISTWWVGLSSSARGAQLLAAPRGCRRCRRPAPPRVKRGRRMSGKPSSFADLHHLVERRARSPTSGTSMPIAVMPSLKSCRSSAFSMASSDAPISWHAVLREDALLRQRTGQVERRLAAHGRQERVGPLGGEDALGRLHRDRLDVGAVGELRVGHDGRGVGVEQDDPIPLLAQRLERLRRRSSRTRRPAR